MSDPVQPTPPDAAPAGDVCPALDQLAPWVDVDTPEASLDPAQLDRALAEHLAQCKRCQRRLSDSAAPASWWEAVAGYLGEPEPDETMPSLAIPAIAPHGEDAQTSEAESAGTESAWGEAFPADLLEPPAHPELLGRLGRYEIERLIGSGGMGLVFRAFDPQLHRVVAVKLLAPQLAASATARERFAREARAVAALAHPHVVAIHDVVAEGSLPYLVMTYIDGVSLEELVQRRGPLSIDHTIQLGRQLCAALATAHEAGLIHRDIKPGNILCEADGQRAVLTDFGLVRTLDDATLTHSGILAGTPHFMAPEQARGNVVGPQADLWGVGAVLYFALTGRPPFDAEHPMAVLHQVCSVRPEPVERLRAEVPPALAKTIRQLLEKRPADRYRNCGSLKDDLDQLAHGGGSWWRANSLWPARRSLRRAAVASVAVVLLGILLTIFFRPPSDRVASDATPDAELLSMQQANSHWRRQLDELYKQTEPRTAIDTMVGNRQPVFERDLRGLLDQLAELETAAEPTTPATLESESSFVSEMQTTLELFEQRTPESPFTTP